jgi:aminoglycoside phosphotransferase (APT) family kinase protein
MRLLDETNAADYLVETGRLAAPCPVRELSGGVSNVVLWIDAPHQPFVLKQARAQLRTKDAWFSRVERIYREADAMRALREDLGEVVPEVLFEDREEFLFGMSAAPSEAVVWKQQLLVGRLDVGLAARAAEVLAAIHQASAGRPALRELFADQSCFYELRLEPFYHRLPTRVPQSAEPLARLQELMRANQRTLVHADFSPKNLLVAGGQFVLVDYETVHFGDPAFDLGFFLAHLTLKTVLHSPRIDARPMIAAFWKRYLERVDFESPSTLTARGLQHLGAILWVRLVGASPVDYLVDPLRRAAAARYADWLFAAGPEDVDASLEGLDQALACLG